MIENVKLHELFSKPVKSLSDVPFQGFDQAEQAYSTSTYLRNSAMKKLNELKRPRLEEARFADIESGEDFGDVRFTPSDGSEFNFRLLGDDMKGGVTALGRAAQNAIVGAKGTITQRFGNRSGVEKYSGGVNYGTDIAVPRGTPVAAPYGEWEVVEAFDRAATEGPNNKQGGINRGYGNSVLLQNTKTGEKLRFSHLRVGGVGVAEGQRISGGTVIGETGATGNTAGKTGQHLDLEYYDPQGRIRDVFRSPYARMLM